MRMRTCTASTSHLLFPDSSCYLGEMNAENYPHGQGALFNNLDGSELYCGSWLEGKMDGLGVQSWSDGSTHEGEFAAGRITGFGVRRCKKGKVTICGLWKDGQFVQWRSVPVIKLPVKAFLSGAGQYTD
jgi:hypothetical protein